MTTDRRLVGAALGLALLVAACGGSSASPTASAAAQASQGTSGNGQASAAPNVSFPDISLAPGAASDLEAMLPSNVGSVTFQKTSVDGSQIAGAGTPIDSSKLDPILSKYGKTIADVRMAIAVGTGGTGPIPDEVYAIQLKGVPASEWATDMGAATSGTSMTVGGKQVTGASAAGMTTGYYTKDDVLFLVVASDADASTIFTALP